MVGTLRMPGATSQAKPDHNFNFDPQLANVWPDPIDDLLKKA